MPTLGAQTSLSAMSAQPEHVFCLTCRTRSSISILMVGTAAVTCPTLTAARFPNSSLSDWQIQCQEPLERWREELGTESNMNADAALRKRIEHYLDQGYGECHLRDPRIAESVQSSFLFFDRDRYRLSAWVIMPNHAHILMTPCAGQKLSRVLHSLKSYTANQANKLASRSGQFWQPESFDRYVRDANHFAKVTAYIENNSVKAPLCEKPEDWPFGSARFRKRGWQ